MNKIRFRILLPVLVCYCVIVKGATNSIPVSQAKSFSVALENVSQPVPQQLWADLPELPKVLKQESGESGKNNNRQDAGAGFRVEDQPLDTNRFSRSLRFTGELQSEIEMEKNFRPGSDRPTQDLDVDNTLELRLQSRWSPVVTSYIESTAVYQYKRDGVDRNEETDAFLELNEYWVAFDDVPGQSYRVRLGRQDFRDTRQWWWDEELLALQFDYTTANWGFFLAYADEVTPARLDDNRTRPREENIQRLLGQMTYRLSQRHQLSLFLLQQNDRSPTPGAGTTTLQSLEDKADARLSWLGFRAGGRERNQPRGRWYYWLDTGFVWGDEPAIDFDDISRPRSIVDRVENQRVRGWGIDFGAVWVTNWSIQSRFIAGYARGSGDGNPNDDTDRTFRQSGLHDNDTKFPNGNRIKRYGELFDPELANLEVFTLGYGQSVTEKGSFEFLYHRYGQVQVSPQLPKSSLKGKLDERGTAIGSELDFVLGIGHSPRVESKFVLGFFNPGEHFSDLGRDSAWFAQFRLQYNI